jgi:hypothetical protein
VRNRIYYLGAFWAGALGLLAGFTRSELLFWAAVPGVLAMVATSSIDAIVVFRRRRARRRSALGIPQEVSE